MTKVIRSKEYLFKVLQIVRFEGFYASDHEIRVMGNYFCKAMYVFSFNLVIFFIYQAKSKTGNL